MSNSDSSLHGCRVLIVEDEYLLASDLEEVLKAHGAKIIGPFAKFDPAYGRAKRDHFDVAVIDINLHGKSACPIADELIRQGIPFVFSTGYDADLIPERFKGVKLWQKPFDYSEIIKDIGQLWRR